ncbi:ArsC family reductase [Herbaspirillum sp. RTI4]|uniref:ArsC family reductase n=1 Tax=Herbaspirillum sp. RTI4 TaxID=3048640 RepID=UPI002AB36D61|nr:ArsC family reductase [Herbaspirillum sp. RTI4]MDY7578670.1 ArsC family reductase [Herbaspirillum sp. RTI4]MEA9980632.1 ArsC family reductase [Herbaspirillum sp. RTI4]
MSAPFTLYGIPNCDTVKKARTWLDAHELVFTFHDFKKAGLDAAQVALWLKEVPWDTLVNRKGTTWRALSPERQASIVDAATALPLILENPSIVKRPVLYFDGHTHVGFSAERYQHIFKTTP